jgi:iron(III)-enterobactin esterase
MERRTFDAMECAALKTVVVETVQFSSRFLNRPVTIDFYLQQAQPAFMPVSLLLINDGQDLLKMGFAQMLDELLAQDGTQHVFSVGIHAGTERKMEYGTARQPDYEGRGAKAKYYEQFILHELLPYIHDTYNITTFHQRLFAGFSLGGLMALDMVWNHPHLFSGAAVFSGSLWWRSKALHDGYDEAADRIMHKQIRERNHHPGQRFYFMTGSLDETSDRNGNGIIDSIDDTLDLIGELKNTGYDDAAICYINFEDGKHDVETWGRAMPHFLIWAFEKV